MIKWLYKSLFLITGIFFGLAILEIHGENSQNTFFDQDDTYVQSNNQNVELTSHIEKQNDISTDLNNFAAILICSFSSDIKTEPDPFSPKNISCNTPKIYLQNSVWRI